MFAVTGCATNGRGVATTSHTSHDRSIVAKTVDEEDASGYSTSVKALAVGAGVVVLIGALAFAVASSGERGMGGDFGNVLMH